MRKRIAATLICFLVLGVSLTTSGAFAAETEAEYSADAVLTEIAEDDEVILEDASEEITVIQEKSADSPEDLIIDPDAVDAEDASLQPRAEGNIVINEINFPDANFRAYVKDEIANGADILTTDVIEGRTSINVNAMEISQLDGIQYFTALKYLDCTQNQLTSLNVSENKALEELYCEENQLTSLDVSGNTALKNLDCSYNQLTSLDVSGNTALESLYCCDNQLTSLDVSGNIALTTLNCSDNQLRSLVVSGATALNLLICQNNQLTNLNFNDTKIGQLFCSDNCAAVVLDDGNTFNLATLSGFDVSKASIISGGVISGSTLTFTDSMVTYRYNCGNNKDVVFNLKAVNRIAPEGSIKIDEINFPDAHFRSYIKQNISKGADYLTPDDIEKTADIYLYNKSISNLKGIEIFTKLKYLLCSSNPLTSIDVSKNTELEQLYCYNDQLTSLDVSGTKVHDSYYFECYGHCAAVELTTGNKLDLNTLPGSFDSNKVSNVKGGTVSGNILTFTSPQVTYSYDCGNGLSGEFKLKASNYPVKAPGPDPQPTPDPSPAPDPQPAPTPSDTDPVPADQTVSNVTAKAKKGNITVSWKNSQTTKTVSKIEVQYATKKNFKKNVKTKELAVGKAKVTLKKLNRKTNYFIRVRYKYTDGSTSNWSVVKKAKTK